MHLIYTGIFNDDFRAYIYLFNNPIDVYGKMRVEKKLNPYGKSKI